MGHNVLYLSLNQITNKFTKLNELLPISVWLEHIIQIDIVNERINYCSVRLKEEENVEAIQFVKHAIWFKI